MMQAKKERQEAKRRQAEADLEKLESLGDSELDDASDADLEKMADQWLAAGSASKALLMTSLKRRRRVSARQTK